MLRCTIQMTMNTKIKEMVTVQIVRGTTRFSTTGEVDIEV